MQDDITEKPNFVLEYFASMQCGKAEGEELIRRRQQGIYIESDGRIFKKTDEYVEDVFPRSRYGALRNKRRVRYPLYRCAETGQASLSKRDGIYRISQS